MLAKSETKDYRPFVYWLRSNCNSTVKFDLNSNITSIVSIEKWNINTLLNYKYILNIYIK